MKLVACSRMYNVTPQAMKHWNALFQFVGHRTGLDLQIIAHAAPAPLAELWSRDDLGCAFMCGWPLARTYPQMHLVVAPVPVASRYGERPIYFSDVIVRNDKSFAALADTFGGRVAWMTTVSHSGFNAFRHHLLPYRTASRRELYRDSIGPLMTPARVLQAIVDDEADVAAIDSYVLDLVRLHEPERLADVTVIDSTAAVAMPPLVASPAVPAEDVAALRTAFLDVARDPTMQNVLAQLALKRFSSVTPSMYEVTEQWANAAIEAGYLRLS